MAMDRDIGTVEKGKLADLIATDADPLEDISALRKVSFVMKGGSIVRDDNPGKSANRNAAINGQGGSR
jgi:imidazolonepropionase-like amidohydrolase